MCMYIVQTCMVSVLNHINMYIQCTNLYIECCVAHVQCTDGYINFMKCTDIAEQGTHNDISFWMQHFYLPGWLACRLGLAAAQCHTYSSSSTLVQLVSALGLAKSLFTTTSRQPLASPTPAPRAGGRWRLLPARCGCCAPVWRGGGVGCVGIVVVIGGGCVGCISIWLKSCPWTCAWPPWTWCNRWRSQPAWYPRNRQSGRFATDMWSCQTSVWSILPLLCPCARVLVHSCCPWNRVNDESMQMWFISFIFYTTKYLPDVHWDPSVRVTTPMKVPLIG